MRSILLILLLMLTWDVNAQLYTEQQTRHRFAQMTLGMDIQTSFGGQTFKVSQLGIQKSFDLEPLTVPRFLIGGTHFWGHADIYIAIPMGGPQQEQNNQTIRFQSGVETVFKFYPYRIETKKVRPFLGVLMAPNYYEQDNSLLTFGDGPDLNHTSFPLITGLTYNQGAHLFEASMTWNYKNEVNYYLNRSLETTIETPQGYFSVSYKYKFDTTLGAEEDWESGRTQEITSSLAADRKLNRFFIGGGLSSAFWVGQSSYNSQVRPYIEKYSTSLMPDFTAGYYHHHYDANVAISYRSYRTSSNTFGAIHQLSRQALGLEITKFLFDYNGFAPFIGPYIGRENLGFEESFENTRTLDIEESKTSYGLTFGWDIRPNRIQKFILRTNLRWFFDLSLETGDGNSINYGAVEFNFIQFIWFLDRN